MGKYNIPIDNLPLFCTPKWLIDNQLFNKNTAYKVMKEMRKAFKDKNFSTIYRTKFAIPWDFAQSWFSINYQISFAFQK